MKNLIIILLSVLHTSVFSQVNLDSILISEINSLRTNPKSYVPLVENYISFQEKSAEMIKSGKMKVRSSSGKSGLEVININIKAAKELIIILNSTKSLPVLVENKAMNLITDKQGRYLDSVKTHGHYGPNGQTLGDRFKSMKLTGLSENVGSVSKQHYATNNFKPLLLEMLIDSFNEDRGHRKNLLNPNSHSISVYVSSFVCVQNFAN